MSDQTFLFKVTPINNKDNLTNEHEINPGTFCSVNEITDVQFNLILPAVLYILLISATLSKLMDIPIEITLVIVLLSVLPEDQVVDLFNQLN